MRQGRRGDTANDSTSPKLLRREGYLRQCRCAAGIGFGVTIKYLRRTTSAAAGSGLDTTTKYLRGAAGSDLGTTIKLFATHNKAKAWAPRSSTCDAQ
jgi:hypothetical protein